MSIGKGYRAPRLSPSPRGEKVKSAKLAEEDIRGIRLMHEDGYSLGYIAKCYTYFNVKISKQQVHRIVNKVAWTHVKPRVQFIDVVTGAEPSAEPREATESPGKAENGAGENKSVENGQNL